LTICVTIFNRHVLTDDMACFGEAVMEFKEARVARVGRGPKAQEPYQGQSRLLRPSRERARHGTTEPCDEITPSHPCSPNNLAEPTDALLDRHYSISAFDHRAAS
jgi:hypothetical protein